MALTVKNLTAEEREQLRQLAHSRTAPARAVERAQMIWYLLEGAHVPAVARRLGCSEARVRYWLKQFNQHGFAGLQEKPRPGRPPQYTPEQVAAVIATALTCPEDFGLPFACWTLDRLQAYLNEVRGIGMKRSRIDEVLLAEGLRWRTQETWFGERAVPIDPQFAEKRGASSDYTPTRPLAA